MTQSTLAEAMGADLARIADSGRVPSWPRTIAGQRRER